MTTPLRVPPSLLPYLVAVVFKDEVEVCPEEGSVTMGQKMAFFKTSYKPSDWQLICRSLAHVE